MRVGMKKLHSFSSVFRLGQAVDVIARSNTFSRSMVFVLSAGVAITVMSVVANADVLDIRELERESLAADPLVMAYGDRANALKNLAVSDGQLPDPQLTLGGQNYPTDTFAGDQEAMTQLKVGLSQQFPSYGTLTAKSKRTTAMSRAEVFKREERRLTVLRSVRLAWLDAYLWQETIALLGEYKKLIQDDIQSVQARFGAGKLTIQRLMKAELSESRLDDRILSSEREIGILKAELGKWVGRDVSADILSPKLPEFPMPAALSVAYERLSDHPSVIVQRENEKAAKHSIQLAEADYLPKFGVGVSYGYRQETPMGTDRSDLASVTVSMSLPFFTGPRQDRRLSASKFEAAAARRRTDEILRIFKQNYNAELHTYDLTKQRLRNLEDRTLPRARSNVSAAMSSYQFDTTDFDALTDAHIAELEIQLQQLRLRVSQEVSLVKLQYLLGGSENE